MERAQKLAAQSVYPVRRSAQYCLFTGVAVSRQPKKAATIPAETAHTGLGLGLGNYDWQDGGRDRDRTCDPLDVNEVLSR